MTFLREINMRTHKRCAIVCGWLACVLLTSLLTACQLNLPASQATVEELGAAVEHGVGGALLPGDALQTFLPKAGSGFFVEIIQTSEGNVEAALKLENTQIATLSIRDTSGGPGINAGFQSSTLTIAGYPALEVDPQTTAILVANRYQVSVRSVAPDFTPEDRQYWLAEFDLAGLAALPSAP